MRIKQIIKHNQFVYKILVGIIEFIIKYKNRIKWTFWKKYPFLARKICNLFSVHLVPVLYFHWFVNKDSKTKQFKYTTSRWYATIEDFEKQIDYLKKNNYHFLTSDEYYQWYVGKRRIPRKSVLLTFDDGEQSLIDLVLPVIRRESVPVIFFVIGKHVLEQNEAIPQNALEDQVCFFGAKMFEQLKTEPLVTLGSHTYNMHFAVNRIKAVDYLASLQGVKYTWKGNTGSYTEVLTEEELSYYSGIGQMMVDEVTDSIEIEKWKTDEYFSRFYAEDGDMTVYFERE